MMIIKNLGGKMRNDILEHLIALMKNELSDEEYTVYVDEIIKLSIKFTKNKNNEKLRKILKEI